MKTLGRISLLFLALMQSAGVALAAVSDPFENATSKANELVELLSGPFATSIGALVIVCAGIALLTGKLRREWAFKIGGGGALIVAAGQLSEWIFT